MSDDEAEEHQGGTDRPTYHIFKDQWRNDGLRKFLRVLDYLRLDMRYNEFGRQISSGSFMRNREPSDNMKSSEAVIGLPRNFYKDEYLIGLEDDELEILNIKPEIELVLPDSLKL